MRTCGAVGRSRRRRAGAGARAAPAGDRRSVLDARQLRSGAWQRARAAGSPNQVRVNSRHQTGGHMSRHLARTAPLLVLATAAVAWLLVMALSTHGQRTSATPLPLPHPTEAVAES